MAILAIPPTPGPAVRTPAPAPVPADGEERERRTEELHPKIRRFTTGVSRYDRVITIRRVRKFMLEGHITNTVGVRVSSKELGADAVDEYDVVLGGDRLVWEASRGNEKLSMNVWARADAAGSPVLVVWIWE